MKITFKYILLFLVLALTTFTKTARSQTEYIENEVLRVGVDISKGGAISYLSLSGSNESVVNIHDRGRYIQQSYYSGPIPFIPDGAQQHPSWDNWAWNPVQAGDCYNNSSQIIDFTNDGTTLYTKSIPKQWALNNVDSESFMETWVTIQENVVYVKNRLTNYREDQTQYSAKHQELPAIYTVGTLHKLFTYNGNEPFTNDALTEISNNGPPWEYWYSMEGWSALVNDDNWGLGIYHPGAIVTVGGFHGTPGVGGPYSDNTGYIAPLHVDIIDHDIVYNYEYALILGDLNDDIRSYVYENAPLTGPNYVFHEDRQHCLHYNVAEEETPTFSGSWNLALNHIDSQIHTPPSLWNADDIPTVFIKAAYHTQSDQADIFFVGEDGAIIAEKRVQFTIIPDGEVHIYEIDLSSNPLYIDNITRLRFDPLIGYSEGDEVDLYSIRTSISTENNILSFAIPEQIGETTIDMVNHTVNIEVPNGTDISALTPTIEVSYLATINPESGTSVDFTEAFTYTVTAENGNQQEWTVTVDIISGVFSDNSSGFNIYPNPSNGIFTLSGFHKLLGLEIIDITGITVFEQKYKNDSHAKSSIQIDLTSMGTGTYFIQLRTEDTNYTKKIIIQ
ncbi:MAG: hypothetical protein B7C24_01655 [Bacteroidetes bacterium 4572_77]|nr:MAG: hypothetical protein B7C24_01655 [Bacteroidetes bacterium 4572_77]